MQIDLLSAETVSLILAVICIAAWQIFALRAAYHGSAILQLRDEKLELTSPLPKLSVIVTARNEERVMEHDLRSLVSAKYPDVEFIVINDRSSDRTGEIIEKFAKQDSRIKPIHITELPAGWLGKVNALNIGVRHASGEYLLFTDADIRFENDVLVRAVAYCEERGIDHLSMLPADRSQSKRLLLPLFVLAFGAMFLIRTRARKVGGEGSLAFTGVGAFNLVRRSAFEKTQGFEWLKMEVLDDVGLGLMMISSGAKPALFGGEGLLSFEWYESLREAIRGLEKNAFSGFAGFSYLRGITMTLSMWCIVLLPVIVAFISSNWLLLVVVICCYSLIPGIVGLLMKRTLQTKPLLIALLPLGYFFVSLALVNSLIAVRRDNGIRWRDTFYPLDELKKGRRLRM